MLKFNFPASVFDMMNQEFFKRTIQANKYKELSRKMTESRQKGMERF